MTRKDYQRAADIIVKHVKARYSAGVEMLTDHEAMNRANLVRQHLAAAFEAFFREDNPRFDPERFRKAIASGLDF